MKPYQTSGSVTVSRFVKISGTNTIAIAGAGDVPVGISQQGGRAAPIPSVTDSPVVAAATGEFCNVFTPGEECQVVIGTGGCTADDLLKPENGGTAIALAGSGAEAYGARALETRSAGELCRVRVETGYKTTP